MAEKEKGLGFSTLKNVDLRKIKLLKQFLLVLASSM